MAQDAPRAENKLTKSLGTNCQKLKTAENFKLHSLSPEERLHQYRSGLSRNYFIKYVIA